MTRPNVVLIMVDQLSARWLDAAWDGVVDLPNLRRLADGGVRFSQALTPNPVCSPARASVATGLTSQGHGVTECGYVLDPDIPTFMHRLQEGGWVTGAFGKLHFRPQLDGVCPDYTPYGFDVTHISEDARAGAWLDWVRTTHPEHYQAAQATVWMTMIPELRDYGAEHVDLRKQIEQAQEQYPEATSESYELPFPAEVSQTAWITDRACDFIRATPAEQPLFAQVSYVQPHNPFAPPAEYVGRVRQERIPDPVAAEWQGDPHLPYFAQDRYRATSFEVADWRADRRRYFADLAHLDAEVGRILQTLEESGRDEDSYVLFTSDHGELLHDHGLLGKWERHYDACIRVPLIISGPGLQAGVREELVDLTDIAPTVLDMVGEEPTELPHPDIGRQRRGHVPPIAGRSLLGLCRGEQVPWRDALYVQSNNNHVDVSPRSWARTIRTDRFRYTTYLCGGGEQLFDLTTDPGEQHNLAALPEWSETRTALRDRLFELVVLDGYPNSPRQLYGLGTW